MSESHFHECCQIGRKGVERLREENASLVDRHNRESHGTASHEALAYDQQAKELERLRQNQCLICEYPADHDARACVRELERLRDRDAKHVVVEKALVAENERLRRRTNCSKDSFAFLGVDPETNLTEVERLRSASNADSVKIREMQNELERLRGELRLRMNQLGTRAKDSQRDRADLERLREENDIRQDVINELNVRLDRLREELDKVTAYCVEIGWPNQDDLDRLHRIEEAARDITQRYAPGEDGWVDRIRAALEEDN